MKIGREQPPGVGGMDGWEPEVGAGVGVGTGGGVGDKEEATNRGGNERNSAAITRTLLGRSGERGGWGGQGKKPLWQQACGR